MCGHKEVSAQKGGRIVALHSRQDIACMLDQLVQVSILPALFVLFFEEHLQGRAPKLIGQDARARRLRIARSGSPPGAAAL